MNLVRFFLTARTSLRRLPSLALSERVPLRLKLGALALALLIVSPLNVLGDIPLLGIADDVTLLVLLLNWFVSAASRHHDQVATASVLVRR